MTTIRWLFLLPPAYCLLTIACLQKEYKMKYLPFLTGTYSTAPGLTPLGEKAHREDLEIFDFDNLYDKYFRNKQECRKENIHKYYLEHQLNTETYSLVIASLFRNCGIIIMINSGSPKKLRKPVH